MSRLQPRRKVPQLLAMIYNGVGATVPYFMRRNIVSYHTWSEVGIQISALLSGGYESIKAAKQAMKLVSQAVLHCVVSANRNDQYLYREP